MFNALLCTSARVPFAMAERNMLPRSLAALHANHATPWRAIAINSVGVAALTMHLSTSWSTFYGGFH